MKAIAVIEILEGGKGKWYIDGEIRYTENESLIKKFDKELISLKPMPQQMTWGHTADYIEGYNACLEELLGEDE